MDYVEDPHLISDFEEFCYGLTPEQRAQLLDLTSRFVEAGMDTQRRFSDTSDCRYYVG
jgi:hypothetical protein